MNKDSETSRTLKSFRSKKGKTLEEASSDIGWHFNTYSRRENSPFSSTLIDLFTMVRNLDGNFTEFLDAIEQDFKSYKESHNVRQDKE